MRSGWPLRSCDNFCNSFATSSGNAFILVRILMIRSVLSLRAIRSNPIGRMEYARDT